jgi:LPXTG-motif cell wall-anchored protein
MIRLYIIIGLILLGLIGLWVLMRRRENKGGNPAARLPPLSDHDEAEDATIPARLAELEAMRERGEITEDEYASRRRHLLGDEDDD